MAVKNIDYLPENYLAKINEEKTTYLSAVEKSNGKISADISLDNFKYLEEQKTSIRDIQGEQIKGSNEERIVIANTDTKKEHVPVSITETQQKKNMVSIMTAFSSEINKEGAAVQIKTSSKSKYGTEVFIADNNINKNGTSIPTQYSFESKDGTDIEVPTSSVSKKGIEVKSISTDKVAKNSPPIPIAKPTDLKKGIRITQNRLVINNNIDKKSTAGSNEYKIMNEVRISYEDLNKRKNGTQIIFTNDPTSKTDVELGVSSITDDGKGTNFVEVPIDGNFGSKEEIAPVLPYTADAMFDAKNLSQVNQGTDEGKFPFTTINIQKDKVSKEVVISYINPEKEANEYVIEVNKEIPSTEEISITTNIEDAPKILQFQSMKDGKITFIPYFENLREKYIDKAPTTYTSGASGIKEKVSEEFFDNSDEPVNITDAIPFKSKINLTDKIEQRKGAQLYKETGDEDSNVIGQPDINDLVNKEVPIEDLQASVFLYNIIPYSLSITGEKIIASSADYIKEKDQSFEVGTGIVEGKNNIYSLMNREDAVYTFTDFLTTFGSGILGAFVKTRSMGTMKDLVMEDPTIVSNQLLLNNTLRYAGAYYGIVANPYEVSQEYGGTAVKGKSNIKSVYHFLKEDTREDGSYMPTLKKYIEAQKDVMPSKVDQYFDSKYLDINSTKAFERGAPREITNLTSYLQGRASLYDIGYIAVFPTNGIQSFKIPFQFNPKVTEGGINAQYAATNFIGRVGAIQTYINTSGLTSVSIDTSYHVLTDGTTNENSDWMEHFTFEEIQNIEYLYRGLVLPSFNDGTSNFEYSAPPLIRVQFGGVKTKDDPNAIGTNIFTYPSSYATGESTYVNFLVTSLTITKDTETMPFVMTGDTGHMTANLAGFDVQLNLVEVSYDYKTILPDFNDYYWSASNIDAYKPE